MVPLGGEGVLGVCAPDWGPWAIFLGSPQLEGREEWAGQVAATHSAAEACSELEVDLGQGVAKNSWGEW